jgi:hypothetical protein
MTHLYANDFEQRTIDSCRGILEDIPECASSTMAVKFLGGVPHLVISFEAKTLEKPACLVRLRTQSLSNPLSEGQPLEGDRLRRAVRNATEQYLQRHGVRLPAPEFEFRSLEN